MKINSVRLFKIKNLLQFTLSKNYSKNIKTTKPLKIKSLNNFYGIGNSTVLSIYNKYGLNNKSKKLKTKSVTFQKVINLANKLTLKNTLRNKQIEIRKFTVKRLKNYKGVRHLLRYPVRGQRTHTNGKTRKKLKSTEYSNLT